MPVTKCEPETTRKASRKSAKTQETALSALLAQTEEVSVPLASLIKSPLNVRTVPYSVESVSELAGSIKGVGLLQNLVVHTLPGDRYGVAAGGRRLAALNMLAERNILPADWPVRVKVIPQELATAASMTENGHRRDMHPAEQIAGFALAQEGQNTCTDWRPAGLFTPPRSANAETGRPCACHPRCAGRGPHHHRALSGAGAGERHRASGAGV
uniref:Putative plasmid stabilization protein n=1 Tax=Escherichia coli TaxID=562 RepID=A0A3Q9EJV3_ECOLX|nr:putative plasmid stabilization protein [Escherichia coli]